MTLKQWLFKAEDGRMVFGEKPNAPIIITAIFYALSRLIGGDTSVVLGWIGRFALIYWAYLEVFKGTNNFRRILGITVTAVVIANLVF